MGFTGDFGLTAFLVGAVFGLTSENSFSATSMFRISVTLLRKYRVCLLGYALKSKFTIKGNFHGITRHFTKNTKFKTLEK